MTKINARLLRSLMSLIGVSIVLMSLLPARYAAVAQSRSHDGLDGVTRVDLGDLNVPQSELRGMIERYTVDRGSLFRSYPGDLSPARAARLKQLYDEWLGALGMVKFDSLSQPGQVDYVLFKNHLNHELLQLELDAKAFGDMAQLIPFARAITDLAESRRRMETIDSQKTATVLTDLRKQVDATRRTAEAALRAEARGQSPEGNGDARPGGGRVKKTVANRAMAAVNNLRNTLRNWFQYYDGYDPIFTWWVDEPYKALDQTLQAYSTFIGERLVGVRAADAPSAPADFRAGGGRGGFGGDGGGGQRQGQGQAGQRPPGTAGARPGDSSDIIGDPIGRDALMVELAFEMIPYTPEELIALANKEMAWCEAEMKKASNELGYGDDWRKALEFVKTRHVEPGKQPELIRDLALEAIKFMDDHDLITVPPLARESWRMEMMTPERQLVNPFFTGGETISVSYPTNTMSHEQKLMSMRGNNIHFSRATVFHELIPGHHLQGFMSARYNPYRSLFSTPFWGEGWALYWELLLWDMKFHKTPEDRIGALFWRMHRCARIIFSLSFHLEKMTPQECIDLLVNKVGHEPENATAEVRRSFAGNYGPLYQAAYLLGGLQIYSLHKELVDSGKMSNRAFHDAVLKENRIPIEMVRALLTKQKLSRDFKTSWKFYGPNPGR